MAYLNDQIKIELVLPEGTHVATLGNTQLKWKKETDRDYGFTLRKLSEVTFFNDSNRTFDKLKVYEQDRTACVQILMKVSTKNHDGTTDLRQTYELPVRAGDWDDDACTVKLEPRLIHGKKCLLDKAKTKRDLLTDTLEEDRRVLRFLAEGAEIQFRQCDARMGGRRFTQDDLPIAECDPNMTSEGWVISEKVIFAALYDGIQEIDGKRTRFYEVMDYVRTTYARQFVAGTTAPAGNWIAVQGGFARPVAASSTGVEGTVEVDIGRDAQDFIEEDIPDIFSFHEKYTILGFAQGQENIEIDNGVSLLSALQVYAQGCGLTIKSDFFGISPDGTAPANKAYAYAADFLHDLLLYQASDIINANASTNATRLEMSFEQFFSNLRKFNVEIVASDDNVLRIEHVSFKKRNRHLNLLTDYKLVKGKRQYTHDKADSPRFERFAEKYTTGSKDFDEAYIEYDALCSDDGKNNERTVTAPNTVSNIGFLYQNEDLIEDLDKQKDTIVFASVVDGVIAVTQGSITGENIVNGPLAWSNIVANLWLWDRPQPMGLVNGVSTEFESVVAIRKQTKMTVKVCKEQFFDDYSEDDLVKAHYGWSEVDDSEYTLPSEHLEIGLKF